MAPRTSALPKTVLADGNFDGLHFGHIEHLRMARELGDRLMVALATDEVVARRKGPGRPRFPVDKRQEMLEALRIVDKVIVTNNSLELVARLCPAVYVKGNEYQNSTGSHADMVRLVESYGGQVAYTDSMLGSSSQLLNHHLPVLGEEQRAFIASIKARHSLDDLNDWLDKCRGLRALVVGEPIADVYHWAEPLGLSPKDSLVVWRSGRTEQWEGGSMAIARHLEGLGLAATLDFGDMPPIVKRRWVWGPWAGKVFSTVEGEDKVRPMRRCAPAGQVTVIADFGHGLLTPGFAAMLVKEPSEFVALTCQANSSNWGFNLLTKWPRADYVVADEAEVRLASCNRVADLERLIEEHAGRMGARLFAVTRGHEGCVVWDGQGFTRAPALALEVVDRMGAGDAFLAMTAPLAYLGAPADVVALMGAIGGAIEVGNVGQKTVTAAEVKTWLKGLLA